MTKHKKGLNGFVGSQKDIIEWVNIPAGAFMMGSPIAEIDRKEDERNHQVTLSEYKISKYEVTFDQYDLYCYITGTEKPNDNVWGRGNRPVINVSWKDANAFAVWMGCRLPSEAEWKYACRAGTTTPFNTGLIFTPNQANLNGNDPYDKNEKGGCRKKTIPVGHFEPNNWGLYDMHGNTDEWCNDWYGDYSIKGKTNPQGPETGESKVIRGDSWRCSGQFCRSAVRFCYFPENQNIIVGFRLVTIEMNPTGPRIDKVKKETYLLGRTISVNRRITNKEKEFNKSLIEWANIPAGTFIMGSPKTEIDRRNYEIQRQVTLSAFQISKYEVTFELYDIYCDATGTDRPRDNNWGRDKRPVIYVNWEEAVAFADWMGCRLPTKAEWEYACRAGTNTLLNTGNNLTSSQTNCEGTCPYINSTKGVCVGKTLPVGNFLPNSWGLYDMHGNVSEWCNDWYGPYSSEAETNPQGPITGVSRVVRGGGWTSRAGRCRGASRFSHYPASSFFDAGIRLVFSD